MNPQQSPSPHGLSADAFSSLFQAIGGLRNVRAAVAMLGCLFAGALLAGLLMLANLSGLGSFSIFHFGIVFFIGYLAGVNAAGILLLDQARGMPSRSLSDALIYALICMPKLIVLIVLQVLAGGVLFLALAVVLYLCKFPGLGPVLFVAVFPLCVVVAGVAICWLFFGQSLSCVAIWNGATVVQAIAQSVAITRTRFMETILLLMVVILLSIVVGIVVFVVLGIGFLPTMAISLSIIGNVGGSLTNLSVFGLGEGGSYGVAAAIGTGLLWAVAATLVTQVFLLGLDLVYLRVTEGLDSTAAEQALTEGIDTARRRAAELGEKAWEAGERARENAHKATTAAAVAHAEVLAQKSSSVPLGSVCPQCRKPVTGQDIFCGECGYKMA